MAANWIKGAVKKPGAFTASAKGGESTGAHISRVLSPGSKASTKEKQRANFAKNMRKIARKKKKRGGKRKRG